MQGSSQQVFEELFQEQENNYCFECGSPSNHWASVNNGIFLCLSCSGLHRGFGVNVSFVRSINMDSWSDIQLAMMKNGGNARLRACFDHYNIPKDGMTDFKYRTKAGVYYREMLKALAEGRPLPNPPSISEGAELAAPKVSNYSSSNYTGIGSTPVQEESAYDKVKSAMGSAADKVSDPEFQQGVKQGVVTFGTTVAVGAKNLATKVNQKVHDPEFREDVKAFGGKIATGTKEAAGKVADKSKEVWANRDEYMQKTSDAAKQGWTAAVGFFKKMTSSDQNQGNANQ